MHSTSENCPEETVYSCNTLHEVMLYRPTVRSSMSCQKNPSHWYLLTRLQRESRHVFTQCQLNRSKTYLLSKNISYIQTYKHTHAHTHTYIYTHSTWLERKQLRREKVPPWLANLLEGRSQVRNPSLGDCDRRGSESITGNHGVHPEICPW